MFENVYFIRMNQYRCWWTLIVSHYHSHLSGMFSHHLDFKDFKTVSIQPIILLWLGPLFVGFYVRLAAVNEPPNKSLHYQL